jgi:hypothetical protein
MCERTVGSVVCLWKRNVYELEVLASLRERRNQTNKQSETTADYCTALRVWLESIRGSRRPARVKQGLKLST